MTAAAPATTDPKTEPRPRRRPELAGHLAFAAGALATVGYLLHLGRSTSFFYDEWSWIQFRRGWRPGNFLVAHNGHFVAVPVLCYHLLFATAGLRTYLPYRLMLLAFHVGGCYALYRYARIRLGPLVALLPAGLLLLPGAAYPNLLWPFQIAFLGALAFGLAGYLALDAERSRRRDVLGCLCLTAAIACSGVGLAMLAGAVARIVLRRQWRRWWVLAVPSALFLAWYLRYGHSGPAALRPGGTAGQLAGYLRGIYLAGVGGLTGHPATQARTLAAVLGVVLLVLLGVRLLAELRRRTLPVDLLAAVAIALVLWGLTALTRAKIGDSAVNRYFYPSAVVLLLLIIEALRGIRLPRIAVGLLALATAASVWTGLDQLRAGARSLTAIANYSRSDFAVLEHTDPAPGFLPNKRLMPVVTAGGYLSAAHDLGSPALPYGRLVDQSAGARNDADRVLRQLGSLRRSTGGRQPAGGPTLTVPAGAPTLTAPVGCELAQAATGSLSVRIEVPPNGITVSSAAGIGLRARRFGPTLAGYGRVPAGQVVALRPLPDGSAVPWSIQLDSAAAVRLCGG